MTASLESFGALVRRLDDGARVRQAQPLTGGTSARVTALEVMWSGGQTGRLVVREYGEANVRRDPKVADTGFRLLRALHAAGLPVPCPRLADSSRALFPAPVLVTDFREGEVDLSPADPAAFAAQVADFLARLHALPLAGLPPLPPPSGLGARPDDPGAALLWDVLIAHRSPAPSPAVLLHGDFWPGNVLWHSGQLAAVLDWEDAAYGDPLADLGNARLELLFFLGPAAVEELTRRYRETSGRDLTRLPLWDLYAALRALRGLPGFGLDPATEVQFRHRLDTFTRAALALL